MRRAAHALAASSLVALVFLCLYWELRGAPLRPAGSWLVVKTLPLLAPLMGVLAGRRYTFKWAMMLALPYFMEGATRAYADTPPSSLYATGEAALAAAFFLSCIAYLRSSRAAASAAAATGSAK